MTPIELRTNNRYRIDYRHQEDRSQRHLHFVAFFQFLDREKTIGEKYQFFGYERIVVALFILLRVTSSLTL